jgi:hypothetical protein
MNKFIVRDACHAGTCARNTVCNKTSINQSMIIGLETEPAAAAIAIAFLASAWASARPAAIGAGGGVAGLF